MFTGSPSLVSASSLLLTEGRHALRTAIFMHHLQHVLDALPLGSQVHPTDVNAQSIPVVSDNVQRSNIVLSVSPGISRADVVALLLAADSSRGSVSWLGMMIIYILLDPFPRILTKSPSSTLQPTLHTLFLPTPFKYLSFALDDPQKQTLEEVLKLGALYAECAVELIHILKGILKTTLARLAEERADWGGDGKTPGGGTTAHDGGELGGMTLGMEVWEAPETAPEATASSSRVPSASS